MSVADRWAAHVNLTVGKDGTVSAMGKSYWCEECTKYAGWEVTAYIPKDEGAPAQLWKGHYYLCSPALIADSGFFDVGEARAVAERLREYRRKVRIALEAEQILAAEDEAGIALRREQRHARLFKSLRLVGEHRSDGECPPSNPELRPDQGQIAPTADALTEAIECTLIAVTEIADRRRARRGSQCRTAPPPPAPVRMRDRRTPSVFLVAAVAAVAAAWVIGKARRAHRLSGAAK